MSTTSASTSLEGSCLCGAIRFSVVAEPIYNVVCHCKNCRRHGGSTIHCAGIYTRAQFTLLSGEDKVTTYTDTSTDSTKPLYRSFCSICGSKMWSKTPLNEEIISLPAGILGDAGKDWTPMKEQFVESKCNWVPEFGSQEGIKDRYKRGTAGPKV